MENKQIASDAPNVLGSPERDPNQWVTGDEPMTGPQASYLKTLSEEAGEAFDAALNKAEASKRIEELQKKTGRGLEN
ncbi:MAG TPA: DUF3072 domain-containing protein [Oligoflexus sp.]|uniref:DUF3072 domain-containing protein n=1 Tax=Oligoflexus sp. TaxID=1971216 RepID=UPI002D605108|nr:DUF3072 domain-containing protein [Oligoflexus sp.]HYX34741.1 DUF3072 domain-containing protein [Oligoflexus sp.]